MKNELNSIMKKAQKEFGDTIDFIWKSSRLIDNEIQTEFAKAKEYFPDDSNRALMRLKFNMERLENVFPYLIATGNLFCVSSLFEIYMLGLSQIITKVLHNRANKTQQSSELTSIGSVSS
jgi:hypothetical protein